MAKSSHLLQPSGALDPMSRLERLLARPDRVVLNGDTGWIAGGSRWVTRARVGAMLVAGLAAGGLGVAWDAAGRHPADDAIALSVRDAANFLEHPSQVDRLSVRQAGDKYLLTVRQLPGSEGAESCTVDLGEDGLAAAARDLVRQTHLAPEVARSFVVRAAVYSCLTATENALSDDAAVTEGAAKAARSMLEAGLLGESDLLDMAVAAHSEEPDPHSAAPAPGSLASALMAVRDQWVSERASQESPSRERSRT